MTHRKYLQQTQFHTYGIISMSCMKQYRPSDILLSCDTPLDQCLCDKCKNCELLLKTLIGVGLKGIPGNRYAATESVMCSDHRLQQGSDFRFPKMECILGECNQCGEKLLEDVIKSKNEQLLRDNKNITWCKWYTKEGKSAPEKFHVQGTMRKAVEELMEILRHMKGHIFRANWNRNIFDGIRRNMDPGYIVQIFDFAMNFRNMYQDEIQSAYYDGSQTAIHAVINYFVCPSEGCNELVTLIIGQITEDLLHDSFVARVGHNAAFRYLAELGLPMHHIIQFCNNCSSQYKSRRPFAEMARSPLDIIRIFFGEKHGKSQCDGFFGRLKSWMTHKIKSRHVIISSASDFFRCCKDEYETPPPHRR